MGEERESHFERAIGEFREGAGKPEKKIMDLIIEVEARGPGLPPSRMLDNLRGRKIQDSIAVSLFGLSKQIQYKSSPNRRQDQNNYSETRALSTLHLCFCSAFCHHCHLVRKSTWWQLWKRSIEREEGERGAHQLEGLCLANLLNYYHQWQSGEYHRHIRSLSHQSPCY